MLNKEFVSCSAIKLVSKQDHTYWLRTCDYREDLWGGGAHAVSFRENDELTLFGLAPFKVKHTFCGISNNKCDTWLMDGVNSSGLTGGLLMLKEGTSVPEASEGYTGIMGMEFVTYVLSNYSSVDEVVNAAPKLQLLNVPYDGGVNATMHFMFTDISGNCAVLEACDSDNKGILTVYPRDKNLGIMTNSPSYDKQIQNLAWFMSQSDELKAALGDLPSLDFGNVTLTADEKAPHLSRSGVLPALYTSHDRFVRLAILKALNKNGNNFSDENMLALGGKIMNSVFEVNHDGIFNYRYLDNNGKPVDINNSHTHYIVVYDTFNKCMYIQPYDSTGWTKIVISPDIQKYPRIGRSSTDGVISFF